MRRSELVSGTKNILNLIAHTGLKEAIDHLVSRARNASAAKEDQSIDVDVLAALNAFSLEVAKFGPIERNILSILQLDDLAEVRKWPTSEVTPRT